MKVVILAGGLGTRLAEETVSRPKPMVEIGGRPILWHIMSQYAHHGFHEFVIALGYKGDVVKEYFQNFRARSADMTVRLGTGTVEFRESSPGPDWVVHLVDTGDGTQTGGRLKRLEPFLAKDDRFAMTYGDGVSNVDVTALVRFHESHGRLATVTAVHPPARFGALRLEGSRVTAFAEKPSSEGGFINGGFFVLERHVLDFIPGDSTLFEMEPLEGLAARGDLMAFPHEGFWQPMDTLRDKRYLEDLWSTGQAPWKVWG